MHLHSYQLRNFRRLRDVHVELASDISIFVGANNSGKTSATQAVQMFLSGGKDAFSLYDFSSHAWQLLDEIGEREGEIAEAEFPTVSLDVWFEVEAEDLYLVIPILPSTAWAGTLVGVRVELAPKNVAELIQRYRAAHDDGREKAAALVGGAGDYAPWPKSLSAYLLKELKREYELRYFVLDHTQFDAKFQAVEGYLPLPVGDEPGGAAMLKSLIKVDFLNAQRHLGDPLTTTGGGRSEDLSKRLSRFYQRNLDKRQDDHQALKALFESEAGLDKHLAEVFKDTLEQLGHLGYPGLNNPRLEIKSALNPASIMTQDARVHYVVGEGEHGYALDRAMVRQRKTGRPVRFELTDQTREALDAYLRSRNKDPGDPLFSGRGGPGRHLTTRQYARLVSEWVERIGLDPSLYGTHSLRRTKATLIYRRTGNLRAVQLLLGHAKVESTVRYLGIEVDDALAIAEQVEV